MPSSGAREENAIRLTVNRVRTHVLTILRFFSNSLLPARELVYTDWASSHLSSLFVVYCSKEWASSHSRTIVLKWRFDVYFTYGPLLERPYRPQRDTSIGRTRSWFPSRYRTNGLDSQRSPSETQRLSMPISSLRPFSNSKLWCSRRLWASVPWSTTKKWLNSNSMRYD